MHLGSNRCFKEVFLFGVVAVVYETHLIATRKATAKVEALEESEPAPTPTWKNAITTRRVPQ